MRWLPEVQALTRAGARSRVGAACCALALLTAAGCGDDAAPPAPGTGRTAATGTAATTARAGRPPAAYPPVDPAPAAAYRDAVRAGDREIVLAQEVLALAEGDGRAAWIADGRVVVRTAGAAPRTIALPAPEHVNQLAIGLDGEGRPTVILASSGHRGPLWSMPADGSRAPSPVPFAVEGAGDRAPGLRRGVVSFSRTERVDGRVRHTVRIARLTSRRSARRWDGAADTSVTRTVPLRGGVAFVTSDDAYEDGSSHALRLQRGDAPVRIVERTDSGEMAPADLGALETTDDGARLVATRWTDDQRTHPWDVSTFRSSDGALLSRRHPVDRLEGDWGVDVPDGRIYTDMDRFRDGQLASTGALVLRRRTVAP